jgi:hypothetical protein
MVCQCCPRPTLVHTYTAVYGCADTRSVVQLTTAGHMPRVSCLSVRQVTCHVWGPGSPSSCGGSLAAALLFEGAVCVTSRSRHTHGIGASVGPRLSQGSGTAQSAKRVLTCTIWCCCRCCCCVVLMVCMMQLMSAPGAVYK